jgi:enamine deaminase RidA (YjgF/YER057c/UK114 family)
MQVRHVWLAGERFLFIYGEGRQGDAAEQFSHLIDRIEVTLNEFRLSMDHAVFHRLWLRSRQGREAIADIRAKRFGGRSRTASSSFISEARLSGTGEVALELVVKWDGDDQSRRIIDFEPPRRYVHYLGVGDWLFLSGIAEEADTLEEKFDKSLAEVERALAAERMDWREVIAIHLFIEHGRGEVDWIRNAFVSRAPNCAANITVEAVDGLASTSKHLEIEIIARRHRLMRSE